LCYRSHDLEDIVIGRAEIVDEIGQTEPDVRKYITSEIRALLKNEDFAEALSGYLLPDAASQSRRPLVE
jgi:predicted transcriptional regulator